MAGKKGARKVAAGSSVMRIRVSPPVLERLQRQADLFGVTKSQYATWLVAQATLGTDTAIEAVAKADGSDILGLVGVTAESMDTEHGPDSD